MDQDKDFNQPCHSCDDDGLYFCRLHSRRYCIEHLCEHLQMATEKYSYTARTNDMGDRELPSEENARTLSSFHESELREQYEFYLNKARDLRNELESRAAFAVGLPSTYLPDYYAIRSPSYKQPKQPKQIAPKPKPPTLTKSAARAVERVLADVRSGALSAGDVITYLKKGK